MTKYPYRKWGSNPGVLSRKAGAPVVVPPPALTGTWVKFPNDPSRAGLYARSGLNTSVHRRFKCEMVIRFHNGVNPGAILYGNDMDTGLAASGDKWTIGSFRVNQGAVTVNSAPLDLKPNQTYTIVIEASMDNNAGPGGNRGYSVTLDGVEVLHHTAPWIKPAWEGGGVPTQLNLQDCSVFGNEYNADRQLEVACRSFRWWKDNAASVSWQLVDQNAAAWLAATSKTPGWFRGYGTITDLV